MPHPTTLVVAAGLSMVGAAIGLSLGRATLDEINPANFKEPDTPFYADLAPNRPRADWAQVQAQEYQAASQATAAPGCAGCTWPMVPAAAQDPAVVRADPPRIAAVPQERVEAPVRIVIVDPPPEPDWRRVERYARYPVERNREPVAYEGDGDGGDGRDAGTQ